MGTHGVLLYDFDDVAVAGRKFLAGNSRRETPRGGMDRSILI